MASVTAPKPKTKKAKKWVPDCIVEEKKFGGELMLKIKWVGSKKLSWEPRWRFEKGTPWHEYLAAYERVNESRLRVLKAQQEGPEDRAEIPKEEARPHTNHSVRVNTVRYHTNTNNHHQNHI